MPSKNNSMFRVLMVITAVLGFLVVSAVSLYALEMYLRATDRPITDRHFQILVRHIDEALVDVNLQESLTLLWENVPDQGEVDARGFRWANPPRENEPEYRVAFMGDSITYGLCGPYEDSYPYLISEMAGGAIESINAGVSGYSSFQGLLQLQEKVMSEEPDVVVISYYHNDDGRTWITDRQLYERNRRLYNVESPLYQSYTWRYLVSAYVRGTMLFHRDIQRKRDSLRVPLKDFYEYTRDTINTVRGIGGEAILVMQPINPTYIHEQPYARIALAILNILSDELAVPLIDIKELGVDSDVENLDDYFYDHCHLTRAGNQLMADAIYAEIEQVIDV